MNISRSARWIVGVFAGLGTIIGAIKSIYDISDHLNGWHVLLALSLLTLLALGLDGYHTWLKGQFAANTTALATQAGDLRKEIQEGLAKQDQSRANALDSAISADAILEKELLGRITAIETKLPPAPQPEYQEALSLRDGVQRFLDELNQQPKADFKLPHDAFNERLHDMGVFERKLSHGFQLRFTARIESLVHRLGEKNIEDSDLTASLGNPPRNLPMLIKIRDALSSLASEVKPK
jgi:hypothetical protein